MKPGENNNILCIGAPGSYKSRGFIIPFLMGCAQRSSGGHHESVVVTDPKGELFENLAPYFREHGFYVKAVNFLDMAHSDGWNCLAGLEANPDLVTTVANTIIQNTSGPKEADDFWSRAELNLLMALIHYVCNLKDARGNLLPVGAAQPRETSIRSSPIKASTRSTASLRSCRRSIPPKAPRPLSESKRKPLGQHHHRPWQPSCGLSKSAGGQDHPKPRCRPASSRAKALCVLCHHLRPR
ncbi:MAG: type IV secretory system conjugative DNA transfer family protein [Oscillibacter sp.]